MVNTYLQNTHASTHNQYKMKILDLFDMAKHGEDKKFNDCGNRYIYSRVKTGPEVIKLFSCSAQLSTKFFLLISVKMPTVVLLAF